MLIFGHTMWYLGSGIMFYNGSDGSMGEFYTQGVAQAADRQAILAGLDAMVNFATR